MPDPPAVQSPTDPKSAAALAQYLQGLFAPAQTGATGLLNQLAAPGGIYDPTADLANVRQKSALANTLPTQADIDAQNAGLQAKGADFLSQQLGAIPVPQEQPLQQPNLPQLQLPGLPQVAQPHVNPLASLLAIGAGFASPKAAGGFNASVLEGALKAAQDENQRRQERDKADVTRRAMIYDASMSAAKEQQRITEANRDTAYRNTVANTDRQMMLAKASTEQFTAHGAADSLKAFADKYDPAFKARDQVKALLDEIDTKGKASAERIKSVAELLTAVHKEDTGGVGMAKDVFNQIMKSVQDAADQRASDARAQKTAEAALQRTLTTQQGELQRTQIIQGHEDARSAAERSLRAGLQQNAQSFDIKKLLLGNALDPKNEPREQAYQNDLKRQQEVLRGLEKSIAESKAAYAQAGNPRSDASRAMKRQIEDLQRSINMTTTTMRQEQQNLEYERKMRKKVMTGGTGTFNPLTGRVE